MLQRTGRTTVLYSSSIHKHLIWRDDFLCLLYKSTTRTEPHLAHVPNEWPRDLPRLSDFTSDWRHCKEVNYRNKRGRRTQEAGIPHRLGRLAECVAREKVGHDTQAEVVEAAEQTMLELLLSSQSSRLLGWWMLWRLRGLCWLRCRLCSRLCSLGWGRGFRCWFFRCCRFRCCFLCCRGVSSWVRGGIRGSVSEDLRGRFLLKISDVKYNVKYTVIDNNKNWLRYV